MLLVLPILTWANEPPGATKAVVLSAGLVIAIGLHLVRLRQWLRRPGHAMPWSWAAAYLVVGLFVWCLAVPQAGSLTILWAIVPAILLGDGVIGRSWRAVAVWVSVAVLLTLGGGLLAVFAAWPVGDGGSPSPFAHPVIGAFIVAMMWTVDVERLWWFRSVVSIDDWRRAETELATARERLRLSDDLHDILGHALEVVAFKAELAARLVDTDTERSRAEMVEVQRVARESLQEVRGLVQARRPVDVASELAGARAVLESAGVACEVTGAPEQLPASARDTLGRVLREAVTNLLRHAEPTRVDIHIEQHDGMSRLRIVNDGVPSDARAGRGDGTGLEGLRRALGDSGGTISAGPGPDGTFQVDAAVPAEFGGQP